MVREKNVKTATTKLKDLELGTKFKLASSDTTGILIEKSIGAATVIVIDVPKTPSFINKDGSIDTYWTGKVKWGPDTEVRVIE